MTSAARCGSCKREIVWTVMRDSGRRMPIDAQTIDTPRARLTAYNPATGMSVVLTADNVAHAEAWARRGVTFHESHFATCPDAAQHRRA